MKVRVGVGAGGGGLDGEQLGQLADQVVEFGFDSLWLPEILTAPGTDPLIGLAWAGAHNRRLKLGTTMLLPGRNPVRLAKQVANLDALSGGRFLVTFVPGLAQGPERHAVGLEPARRGAAIDEVLPLLRRLWAGETVSHDGPAGRFEDVRIDPLPVQDPFDVWLGGSAPAALERCGRLADGWLPAFCTPEEAARGRVVVERAAADAGRTISPEHFGVSIGYASESLPHPLPPALLARLKGRPVEEVLPSSLEALRTLIRRFVDVGFSKFVVRPMSPPVAWRSELERLAGAVATLQT